MRWVKTHGLLPFDPDEPAERETMLALRAVIHDRAVEEQAIQRRFHLLEGLADDPNATIRNAVRAELELRVGPDLRAAKRLTVRAKAAHNKQARAYLRARTSDEECDGCP